MLVNFNSSISKAKFHSLNKDLFSKCTSIIAKCLKDANMSIASVDEVILAGGSTRIPLLQSTIRDFFKGKMLTVTQNSKASTAYGAAFHAFSVSTRMNGRVGCFSLLDVLPFSLGLQSTQGEMTFCVPKNTTIPAKMAKTVLSRRPNMTKVVFEVYEGEGKWVNQNSSLGKFELFATSFAPIGCEVIVTFEVQVNGTLTVMAEDSSSGVSNTITITPNDTEDCKRRVWAALIHREREVSAIQNSPRNSLTQSTTSSKWDEMKGNIILCNVLSMDKEKSVKIKTDISKQPAEPAEYAIGIDFGTTYSSVAVWQRNRVKVIENEYGSRLTYSAVAFTDTGRMIGDTIHKEQVTTNPASTIPNIKRLIGRCCPNLSSEDDNIFLPFRVRTNDKGRSMVLVQYKEEEKHFAPEEIAAMVLTKMKGVAEAHLSSKVSKAVISVPASFNDSQRKAIKDAGVIAGLDVLQLLNETTAAAIGYFLQNFSGQSSIEKTLLVFDLGGGILDVSIVEIKEGTIRVQAVAGDTNLGGEDFDNNMVSYFSDKFKKEKKNDNSNKPRSLRRLRSACEKAKRVLSINAQTVVEIDALDEGIDFRSVITRTTFEEIKGDLFKRSIRCVGRCLNDAMIDKKIIDEVLLVGRSSRIPKMQQLLQEYFEGKELCKSINADEAVVYGAAVQAAILSGNEDKGKFNISNLQDVTSQSLLLDNRDGATMNMLIGKHTPIPAKKELIFVPYLDNLSSISIEVQQCDLASSLVFSVSGITPKPRGNSEINLSFEVDHNGILNLTAKDVSGRAGNEIVVAKENSGLTTEEIQKMVERASCYKAEDEKHKAKAAALNSLESLAYNMIAIARDPGVSATSKKSVEKAAYDAVAFLETSSDVPIAEIDTWIKKLEVISRQIVYLGTAAGS